MKHAYLIIAHNEFDILRLLVESLDDARNDIFVHIDKKVRQLPKLSCQYSRLFVLENRVDVRWGHVSQIACELRLFETAAGAYHYDVYHLISGTHLPLCSQDYIHSFFDALQGKNVFSNLKKGDCGYQEVLKVHRINLFLRGYTSRRHWVALLNQWMWKCSIAIQKKVGITINDNIQFYWANNWCSLSHEAVLFLILRKKQILRRFRWSFCGDEWFVPTELMASVNKETIINSDRLLFGKIGKCNAAILTKDDYESIVASGCLFARKFSQESIDVAKMLSANSKL